LLAKSQKMVVHKTKSSGRGGLADKEYAVMKVA